MIIKLINTFLRLTQFRLLLISFFLDTLNYYKYICFKRWSFEVETKKSLKFKQRSFIFNTTLQVQINNCINNKFINLRVNIFTQTI